MSSDLLDLDSFYQAPQSPQTNPTTATNDLSFLGDSNGNSQTWQSGSQTQAHRNTAPAKATDNIWGDISSFTAPTNSPRPTPAQNDIWGAFKAVPDEAKPLPQAFNTPRPGLAQTRGTQFGQPKPGIQRIPTLDLFSSNAFGSTVQKPAAKVELSPPSKPQETKNDSFGEVLFDAEEEQQDDDDDFGDFETVTAPAEPTQQPLDLLFGATTLKPKPDKRPSDLLASPNTTRNHLPYPQAPKSPSFQERNPFAELGLATNSAVNAIKDDGARSISPVTAWPTYEPKKPKPASYEDSPAPNNEVDDDWGDFADLPPETPDVSSAKETSANGIDTWSWDWADKSVSTPAPKTPAPLKASKPIPTSKVVVAPKVSSPVPVPEPQKAKPPPTNIPPPSVLLTLFPPLFNLPQTTLFQPVADQPFSLKNRILSDPSTVKFLRSYLLIATVAARIIAGRKLRWKRDAFLSQAMKIGPAAAGGKSGMKLAGVDKAEVSRENREATEVVRVWKEQLGRLKSAVAAANSSNHDILSHMVVPDIGEVMHVNTLKGAMTDAKACLLCGLKREERIAKVDIDDLIEDSFGEWWIGYWGHRDCRNFWEEHESRLKHH